jgi:hypothetical protein
MSLLTKINNKLQYTISQAVSDPNADAYAKQQADQLKQDAETKKRIDEAKMKEEADIAAREQAEKDAEILKRKSTFSSSRLIGNAAAGILNAFITFFLAALMLYSGHLVANEAIGYNIPFRLLSFVYGALLFFWIIPKSLIQKYYYMMQIPYHAFLPLSTYEPVTSFEKIVYGPFCYVEDETVTQAKQAVEALYNNGYLKSIGEIVKSATAIASAAAVTSAVAVSKKENSQNDPVAVNPVTNPVTNAVTNVATNVPKNEPVVTNVPKNEPVVTNAVTNPVTNPVTNAPKNSLTNVITNAPKIENLNEPKAPNEPKNATQPAPV